MLSRQLNAKEAASQADAILTTPATHRHRETGWIIQQRIERDSNPRREEAGKRHNGDSEAMAANGSPQQWFADVLLGLLVYTIRGIASGQECADGKMNKNANWTSSELGAAARKSIKRQQIGKQPHWEGCQKDPQNVAHQPQIDLICTILINAILSPLQESSCTSLSELRVQMNELSQHRTHSARKAPRRVCFS